MNTKQAKQNIENESLLRQEAKRVIRRNELPVNDHAFIKDTKHRSFEDNEESIYETFSKNGKDNPAASRSKVKRAGHNITGVNREEKENESRIFKRIFLDKKYKEKDLSKKRRFITSKDSKEDIDKEEKSKKLTTRERQSLEYFKKQLNPKNTINNDRTENKEQSVQKTAYRKRFIRKRKADLISDIYDHAKYHTYDEKDNVKIQSDTYKSVGYLKKNALLLSTRFIPNALKRPKRKTVSDMDLLIQEKKNLKRFIKARKDDELLFSDMKLSLSGKIASKIKRIIKRNQTGLVIAAICLSFIVSAIAGTGIIFHGMAQAVGTYMSGLSLSTDFDMTDCENYYTKMEADLQDILDNIEEHYPGYDRYIIDFDDEIGHDPYKLMAYLSAVYEGYDLSLIRNELNELFNDMYMVETQIETVTENEKEIKVFSLKIVKMPWDDLMADRINEDKKDLYESYNDSGGGHQAFHNPFLISWSDRVTSEFGWRIHPISGKEKFHRGIDIGMPDGTPVKSCSKGIVIKSTYSDIEGNYVVVEDESGYRCHYMHLSQRNVSEGDEVDYDSIIGNVGSTGYSTGPHLHLQITDKEGECLNPRFMVKGGD